MKEVIVKYTCDVCGDKCDRHFKVKVPNTDKGLKKWKRFDMCDSCYIGFYRLCTSKRNEEDITVMIMDYVKLVEMGVKTIDDVPLKLRDIVSTIIAVDIEEE